MAASKVVLGNETLIDLTGDDVAAAKMLSGTKAHDKTGAQITGNIATKSASDLTASGKTVTVPAGYYGSQATKSVADGTVTNNTTLPSGKTSSGTVNRGSYLKIGAGYHAEKYYKAQANSGTLAVAASGETNCDGYAKVSVAAGNTTQNAPTVNSSGLVTATSTVTAGYQAAGTKSNTLQLSTQGAATITPTRSEQTAVASGKYTTGVVKVAAIPNTYYTKTEAGNLFFPVGSLYATESSTVNPATVLGFGTWSLIAPANTLNELKSTVENFVTVGIIYVWRRTA